jgi:hypothetical protein
MDSFSMKSYNIKYKIQEILFGNANTITPIQYESESNSEKIATSDSYTVG